jgi:hypothetical protein
LPAARLYLNTPPEAPKNLGHINRNLNEYHSHPIKISSTFSIPDITNGWRHQQKTHSKYANLPNVACDKFSITPHGVGEKASFSLGQDRIGWRQSEITAETIPKKIILRQFSQGIDRRLAGDNPVSDTMNTSNDSNIKTEAEERTLHRIAKVHDCLKMLYSSQILGTTQKESRTQNQQMTLVGYIWDPEEIVKTYWALFQHDGAAIIKMSEWSLLPPAGSEMDLPGGQTQIVIVCRICRLNRHPVKSDQDSPPESIPDTDNWLNWTYDLDNRNASEDVCAAGAESDIEHNNTIEDLESPEQQNVSAPPNVPQLGWQTLKWNKQAENVLVPVNSVEMRRNNVVKKK